MEFKFLRLEEITKGGTRESKILRTYLLETQSLGHWAEEKTAEETEKEQREGQGEIRRPVNQCFKQDGMINCVKCC